MKNLAKTCKSKYTCIELFAGAGGLALGLEEAGFETILLNEWDKHACNTLRYNRPNWNVIEQDICKLSFGEFRGKIDLLSGGFPCQAFSRMQVKVWGLRIFVVQCFLSLRALLMKYNQK